MRSILRHTAFVLLLSSVTSCGTDTPAQEPESTWMLGTWSDEAVGFETNDCTVGHLKFEADGTLLKGGFRCGSMGVVYDEELVWERDGVDAVIVHFPDNQYYDGWHITIGD